MVNSSPPLNSLLRVSSTAVTCFAGGKGGKKKETKLGLSASRKDDFGNWYSEAVIESEMISYYDVSGEDAILLMRGVAIMLYLYACTSMLASNFSGACRLLHPAPKLICHLGGYNCLL